MGVSAGGPAWEDAREHSTCLPNPPHATRPPTLPEQVDVLLAQPLRLGAMAEEGRIDLSHVRLLVLDEADKLFDMGFTEQVGSLRLVWTVSPPWLGLGLD